MHPFYVASRRLFVKKASFLTNSLDPLPCFHSFIREEKVSGFNSPGKLLSLLVALLILAPGNGLLMAQTSNKKFTDAEIQKITSSANASIAFVENQGQWPAHVLYRADVAGGQMLATPQGMLIGVFNRSSMSAVSTYDMRVEEIQTGHRAGKIEDLGPAPALKGFGWRLNFIGGNNASKQTIERSGESKDVSNYLTGDVATTHGNIHSYNVIQYKDVYQGVDVKYYTAKGGSLENDVIVHPGADASQIDMQIEGVDDLKMDTKGGLVLPTTVGNLTIPSPVCYLLDGKGQKTIIKVKYHLTGKNQLRFDIPQYDKSQTLVIDPIVMRWATWIASNTSVAAHCHGVDLDAAGNIYVVSRGGNGLVTVGAFQTTYTGANGSVILWISKYQEPVTPGGSGVCVWQTYMGGTSTTNPYACTVGPDGYLYIDGITNDNLNTTYGTGAPTPTWTQRTIVGGGQQAFVAKVAPTGAWATVRQLGSTAANLNPNFYDLRVIATGGNNFDLLATGYVTQQTGANADGDVPVAQYPNGTTVTTGTRTNGYVVRLSNNLNTIRWTKQFASSGNLNQFYTTAVDGAGNVLVGGNTNGATNISYTNLTQPTIGGNQDGWLMSLDSATGNAHWSRYFNSGTAKTTNIFCMELNQQKTQVVIGGTTTGLSAANISTGAYQTTYPGSAGKDFFIASLPVAATSTTWGTYFGGNGNNNADNMMGLNIDQNNDVYVLGYTNSKFTPITIPATNNPIQSSAYDATNYDAIFFKLSGSTGDSLLFYTYLGGKSNEEDPTGERGIRFYNCRIYLAITSESNDFPLTRGTIDSVYSSAQGSVYLPVIVSMANPPDLAGNSITSGGNQTVACGQAPQLITASTPAYIIPTVIRNGVGQANVTAGAYPNGLPSIASYQWQASANNGVTWTSIPGATTQNYTPAPITGFTGTYLFRRTINGDYCSLTGDTLAVVTILVTPAYAPPPITTNSPLCAGQTLDLSTPAQTGFTYAWTGPNGFNSTLQNPTIANATSAVAGNYFLIETNTGNRCPSYKDSALVAISAQLPPPAAGSNSPVCSGDTIKLTATGTGNTFSWTGPNGFTSTLQNPIITNVSTANAGNYQVTQSNGGACVSAPATVTVTLTTAPAVVAGNNGPVCSGGTLQLTAGTVQNATYSWTGPNGFTSTLQNPAVVNVTSAANGTYTVVANINGCNSAPGTTTVTISTAPAAPAAGNNGPVCEGTSLSLTAGNIAGATYSWTGPNGFTSTLQNPTINNVVAANSGIYSVIATISGCSSDTANTLAIVNPTPATPLSTSNSPVCQDSTLLLSVNTITGGTYSWTGPNGFSSTLSNPTIPNATSAASGTYFVVTTVSNCPSARAITSVLVNTTPVPVATSNGPICQGATLLLNTGTFANATFSWTGQNGFTSTLQNPTISNVTAVDSGVYSVTLTINGCPASAAGTVHVSITTISPPVAGNNGPLCAGSALDLTASTIPGATYSWNGPNGFSSTLQNPTIPNVRTVDTGTYNVTANVGGCKSSLPGNTYVIINPLPRVTAANNGPLCDSATLQLTASSYPGATYSWTGPNGFVSTLQNPSITFATVADTGTYSVIATASGCSSFAAATTNVLINAVPPAPVVSSNSPLCTGDTLRLTASSANNSNYSWSGPNGFSSTLQNPAIPGISVGTAGTYTVYATIAGCRSYAGSATVVVNPVPSTPTVSSNTPVCAGGAINLTTSNVQGASFNWTGPNGFTSTVQNPTIANASTADSGTYVLFETVSGCSSAPDSTLVVVYGLPAVPVAGSNSPVCLGDTLFLTATSVPGATYSWTGLNGFTSTDQNPVVGGVTLTTASTYTVVASSNGCSGGSSQVTVIVSPRPVVSFTSTAPQCAGAPVNFNNTGSTGGGFTYFWNFGPNATPATSTAENPIGVVFSTGGNIVVSLTVSNGICSSTDSQSVAITAQPQANFVNDGPACFPPGVVTFTDSSSGTITSWLWNFGTGATPATSTSQGPITVTYASQGTQNVTLTVTSGSCTSTTTETASVGVVGADFTSSVPQNGDNGCLGQPVNFYNIGTTGSGAHSYWNFGAGAVPDTSTVENPTNILYLTTGAKIVTHIVYNNNCGLADTIIHIVTINPIPVTTFTSTAPVCANTSVNFTNTGSSGVNYTYFWDFGAGASPATSVAQNPSGVSYTTSGTKNVTFTITNGFYCSIQTTQNIVINSTPVAAFSSSAPQCTTLPVDFTNTGTTTSGVSWNWNFGTGATPATATSQNPTGVTYALPGIQVVQLVATDNNSGCADTASQAITIHQTPAASFTTNAPQCSVTGFNFTNTGSTGGSWSYTWNFGQGANPAISSAENPAGVLYGSGGNKTVTFTVSGQGCTQTSTQVIIVDSTPTASFASTAPQCTGLGVNFSNTSTATGVTYAWDFGPGATPATSTDQNPTGVVYSTAGTKTVTLVVTNIGSGCSETATANININQSPVASFTSNAPQCSNVAINFTNTGSTGGSWSYAWSFGLGASPSGSSAENPGGVLYASSGNKTVSLTVSGGGCTQTSTQTIVISSTPVASFISNAPQCTGLPVNFSNTGTSTGVTWSWNFGSGSTPGTSNLQNPTGITYTTAGLTGTTLTVTDSASGCSATASQTYNIPQSPVASFTSNAPQCSTVGIDFTNTGSTGGSWSYSWDLGQGAVPAFSSSENPTGIHYTSSGTKTITFTVASQYCTQTSRQTIVIHATPVASFTSTAPQCTGLGVNFTNTGSTTGVSYNWNFGSGSTPATDSVQNPAGVIYATAGTTSVTLTVTDTTSGCSVTATNTITIYQSPTASFTSTAPQCSTVPINFTNTGSTGNQWSYNWDFGVGANPALSLAQNPGGVLYSSSGTKTVTFTVSSQNCTQTATQNIVINSTPAADFNSTAPQCTGLGVDFTSNGTSTNVSWIWNFGAGATPGIATTQNVTGVTYASAGNKTVTLTVTDTTSGCSVTANHTFIIHQTPTASFTSNAPQCSTVPINFVNTGSTGGNWYYSWNLGQNAIPAVSSAENPTGVIYSSSGSKIVTFTISDQNCTQTAVDTIVINATPTASFNSTAPQCTGLPVNFNNTGSTTGVTWSWNFGPSATPVTSTSQNPAGIIYSIAGTQTVTLTTTDTSSGCSVTISSAIAIHQTPVASFTSNAPQCSTVPINFTNTGSTGGNWSYSWNFGVGASPSLSSGQNPSGIVYSSSGSKVVTFTISDQNCTQTSADTIVISPTPSATFTSNAPKCTGLPVNFTNTGSSNGVTWNWNFGPGATPATSTSQYPSGIIYSTAGTIAVTLTISDTTSQCAVTTTSNIAIYQTPTATFTSNAPQCANTPINFTNTGSTGGNWVYSWDFGQNAVPASSSAQNPGGVLYDSSGTKTVTFTISDANCAQTITNAIVIDTTPIAGFTSTAPQCTGLPVNFTNIGSTTGVTWLWNLGTAATPGTSVSQNPAAVIYNTAGIQTITLTITDISTSCSTTATGTINIYQTPTVTFTSTAPQCANVPINFNNTGSSGSPWSFSWDFGQNSSPAVSSSENPGGVLYDSSGAKTVTFTVSDANCSQSTTQVINVSPLPLAEAGLDTTICANTSVRLGGNATTPGATYAWFPSSTLDNPYVPNPIASPNASITTYSVTVTAPGTGCKNTGIVVVTMLNPLIANAGTSVEICLNDSIGIGAGLIEGQYYHWTPAAGLSSATVPNPVASPTHTTVYTLTVSDTVGCAPISDNVTVTVNPLPNANAGPDDTIQIGGAVQLTGTGGVQYAWSPSSGLNNANLFNPVASPDSNTVYVLTVTNVYGCQSTDTMEVKVLTYAVPWWIPSAFTPNGDGHNDMLFVRGGGFNTFEFQVYNRYGELMFDSKNINEGWDGNTLNGQPAPLDAYVYKVHGVLNDGTLIDAKGLVNLVR